MQLSFHMFISILQGFILASGQAGTQGLVIAQLPLNFRLDTPWPMQKLPLRATPHKITHIPEYNIYALLLTKEVMALPLTHRPESSTKTAYLTSVDTMSPAAWLYPKASAL